MRGGRGKKKGRTKVIVPPTLPRSSYIELKTKKANVRTRIIP